MLEMDFCIHEDTKNVMYTYVFVSYHICTLDSIDDNVVKKDCDEALPSR